MRSWVLRIASEAAHRTPPESAQPERKSTPGDADELKHPVYFIGLPGHNEGDSKFELCNVNAKIIIVCMKRE
ncbi:MAG: hypothetical protein RR595_01790 [Lysinibacillus sp.]